MIAGMDTRLVYAASRQVHCKKTSCTLAAMTINYDHGTSATSKIHSARCGKHALCKLSKIARSYFIAVSEPFGLVAAWY